jgi:cell division protein FtsI (penicillin-binding protein 3)
MAALRAARAWLPTQQRLVALGVVMVLVWGGIGFRLFQVQVVHASEYSDRGLQQRLVEEELSPTRGRIFDRNGDPLALTIDGVTLYAVPEELNDPILVAQRIAQHTDVDVDDLRGRLSDALAGDVGFVYLARQLEPDVAAQLLAYDMAGVYPVSEPKRMYPTGVVASQVLGVSNIDGQGIEGLELMYDDILTGVPGRIRYERAENGTNIPQRPMERVPAVPGDDLMTTLDTSLQFAAGEACAEAVERTSATSCWVVVMQPETGEILAMAGAPFFDPELRMALDGGPFSNSVVRDQYEPGSTQKLITLAAALETDTVETNTVIPQVADRIEINEGACISPTDDIRGCYADIEEHETRDMTVQEIFTISSNVGTIKIASRLPDGALDLYMRRFGFGQRTGVDFNGEAVGQITVDDTCSTCLASASIGYSVAVTPLQLAAAYGAIANDGVWVEPHLVAEVNGQRTDVEARRVVSENTAWAMRQLLGMVVSDGTGTEAQITGYQVGGKTGTSSKLTPEGTYSDDENIASFVGMAPIDDPKVVVAVVVDNPAFEYRFGGLAAAPVFSEVMSAALQRMGVAPDVIAE